MNKCIYGLVWEMRKYYTKATEILQTLGFIGGNGKPCLYVKKSEKGIVYVVLYIDDKLIVGDVESIDKAIAALTENGLVLKILEGLKDY